MNNSMIRPQPLPDELGEGYAGRIANLNGWQGEKSLYQNLLSLCGHSGASLWDVQCVQLLAQVAGTDLRQFARDHTMLPLWRAIVKFDPGHLLGGARQTGILRSMALRPMRKAAFYCPACAREDIGFHGQSYWRREHQIPGRTRCARHKVTLNRVALSKVICQSPAACMVENGSPCPQEAQAHGNPDHVERFLEICSHLLNTDHPRDERSISRLATSLASKRGFHTGKGAVKKPLVSDRIAELFGPIFLDELFPGLSRKPAGTFWPTIDDAFRGKATGRSAAVYVAVFAALTESADEAALVITQGEPTDTIRVRSWKSRQMASENQLALLLGDDGKMRFLRALNTLKAEDVPLSEACRREGIALEKGRGALDVVLDPFKFHLANVLEASSEQSLPRESISKKSRGAAIERIKP